MFSKTNGIKLVTVSGLIILATVIAYHQMLNNDFIDFDTRKYIIENTHIQSLTWENFKWMLTTFEVGNWHPLTWFSHAIDYAMFGLNPWGHHFMNLLFHCLNVVMFFGLGVMVLSLNQSFSLNTGTEIMVPSDSRGQMPKLTLDNKILLAAGLAALLFGIHPQHVESVAWEAERKDVLCLLFTLITLLCYLWYTLQPRRFWYLVALFSFILALLSKPMAVTVPIILILLDIYPLRRTSLTRPTLSVSYLQLVWEKVPFLGLTILSILVTLLAQGNGEAIASLDMLNLPIRILNAFNTVIVYLSKFLFPVGLSPFYAYPHHIFHQPTIAIPIIATILITVVTIYLWYRRQYYWLISWLFYLVTLAPVIGIVQVGSQAAADRYTYLPTLPFYLLIGSGIATWFYLPLKRYQRAVQVGILAGVMIVVLLLIDSTQRYSLVWRNKLTFWTYIVLHNPNHAFGQGHICRIYFRAGDFEKALPGCQAALAAGYSQEMYLTVLLIYLELGRNQEAIETYNYLVKNHLGFGEDGAFVHYRLAKIYLEQGEMVKVKEMLKKTLEFDPKHQQALELWQRVNR